MQVQTTRFSWRLSCAKSTRVLICVWLISLTALAAPTDVRTEHNLSTLATAAATEILPIMLIMSAEHCGYCKLLREEIVNPMLISGDYDDKVIVREFMIDSNKPVLDFEGKQTSGNAIAKKYKVSITPTVLFLDAKGQELNERMIGINNVDFYGYRLDRALEKALSSLHAR